MKLPAAMPFGTIPSVLSQRAQWAGGQGLVSLLMAKALAHPHLISLAAGFVDQQSLPVEPTGQALDRIWSDPALARAALQYGTTIGYPPLREAVLDRMLRADHLAAAELGIAPSQVVLTAGSNQLLYLVGDVLLSPGDIVLCGSPTYFVFLATLANLGGRAVGVKTDAYGLIPEAAEEELARLSSRGELSRVKALYITSYYDNPTGITLREDRRAALVEVARRWSRSARIYVIEDTAYRELRYYGEDTTSLRSFDLEGDTVIAIGSFSKSYSPGIRVGWGMLPGELVEPVLAEKGNLDFGSPSLNQVLMATVLTEGLYDPHVERLRQEYRVKLDAMLAAVEAFLSPIGGISWIRPAGGLYLWLQLPDGLNTGASGPLLDRAVEEGVLYVPGEYCFPKEGSLCTKNHLRLSFGVQGCEGIRGGVEALARAISSVV
ncbi:MAG: PLP-dependent aminotransferase family protein [Thermoguttaceae bacterium]